MSGYCKMIYAGVHVRYGHSVSVSLESEEIRSVMESASKWLGIPLGTVPQSGPKWVSS